MSSATTETGNPFSSHLLMRAPISGEDPWTGTSQSIGSHLMNASYEGEAWMSRGCRPICTSKSATPEGFTVVQAASIPRMNLLSFTGSTTLRCLSLRDTVVSREVRNSINLVLPNCRESTGAGTEQIFHSSHPQDPSAAHRFP